MTALVQLKHLSRSYPQASGQYFVLRDIDLTIQAGEFISITGPSGSGKSSLLNVLGLLDAGYSGSYGLDGQTVETLSATKRQQLQRDTIGFVFQHYHLLDDLTVSENLALPLEYRNLSKSERASRVAEMLDRFQIVAKKDLFPRQLSGGQQQLVAVARALIARPKLLLADEPTGALHADQGKLIMDLLSDLHREGLTIIQVTHNAEHAARALRQVRLRDGWME
jgi:putative ABC transport system ATP-binding protein